MSADSQLDSTETIPDDVRLPCNCHFHWECLLDSYELSNCPNCSRNIVSHATNSSSAGSSSAISASASSASTGTEQILVDLHNEGGFQTGIDIFPLLKEESYLRAYPEERKSRAFLEFCCEGDVHAIVELLKSGREQLHQHLDAVDDDGDGDGEEDADANQATADEILRYQDPIGEMASGLHAAAANGHREVAWLLLLLASQLPELEFPALVFQEAAALGVMREEQEGKVDIRSLRDAQGRTAEDVAREAGVIWHGWIGNGRLAMP